VGKERGLSDLQALVLGFVQGFTEWLPISSTGHLRVVPEILGWSFDQQLLTAFTAISQFGTLLAAIIYFRRDIVAILTGRGDEGEAGRKLLVPVVIGTLPVVVLGLALHKVIEHQFRSLTIVASSMIVFALALAWSERRASRHRGIGDVTLLDGLAVGIGQAFSLIPGASRSGTTMTAAMACGFERATAARFSFLLSLPAVFAAGAYEMVKVRHSLAGAGMVRPTLIATVVAFVVGWATIDWLLKFLKSQPTTVFVIYRIVVGAAVLALLAAGRLTP
jgi:undecaprenyl-diphosphatase